MSVRFHGRGLSLPVYRTTRRQRAGVCIGRCVILLKRTGVCAWSAVAGLSLADTVKTGVLLIKFEQRYIFSLVFSRLFNTFVSNLGLRC